MRTICNQFKYQGKGTTDYFYPLYGTKGPASLCAPDYPKLDFKLPKSLMYRDIKPVLMGVESFMSFYPERCYYLGLMEFARYIQSLSDEFPKWIYVKIDDDCYMKFSFDHFQRGRKQHSGYAYYQWESIVREDEASQGVIASY
ncbi:MAG: hypothetical protein II530_01425 [Bacteroidaceae bacterium]|nr:hypothetical protein [Bacteroidaceae bacterium]